MSTERLPWFACYPSNLLGAMTAMRPDEQLVYVTTLLRIYETGGPIADDADALACRTKLTPKRVAAAIQRLCQIDKLRIVDDGRLMNPIAQEKIEDAKARASETSAVRSDGAKKRWQKHKQNQQTDDARALVEHNTSSAEAMQTDAHKQEHIHKQEDKDSRSVPASPVTRPSERFEEFWLAYPRRDGANPKAPAEKKFAALVKSGVSVDEIIAGAKRYAEEMRNKGQERTQYVAQTLTWLNQLRWKDYKAKPDETSKGALRGVYAKRDSEQWNAWDKHLRATRGRGAATDRDGGWLFPSEWPPDYTPRSPDHQTPSTLQ